MGHSPKYPTRASVRTSWDPVAKWYSGWVGKKGSLYHRKVAIPTVLGLSNLHPGEHLLDLGCGSGVLAPHVLKRGAGYVGVDASRTLIRLARQFHGGRAAFLQGDVRRLPDLAELHPESFDVVVFMLSIQDMDPLEEVLRAGSWALKAGGRLVIFMLHPCFRVPRGSGWGVDEKRKLTYRRVERYLGRHQVPMKAYAEVSSANGSTLSFHRPLTSYVNALAEEGLYMDRLEELRDPLTDARPAQPDIPLFVALRARKLGR